VIQGKERNNNRDKKLKKEKIKKIKKKRMTQRR